MKVRAPRKFIHINLADIAQTPVVNSVKNSRKRTDHGEITEGHEGTKRRKSMIGDAPAAGSDGIVVSGAFDSPQEHWAPQLGSPHQEADSVLQSTEQYDGDNNHHMIGDAPTAGSDGIVVSEAFALPQGHWAPQLGGPHQEFQPTQSSNVTNPEDVLVSDSYVTHLEPLIDPQMFQNWYYSSYQPNHGPLGGVDSQDQDGSEGFNKSFSDLTSS